jgi:hypothetical protein
MEEPNAPVKNPFCEKVKVQLLMSVSFGGDFLPSSPILKAAPDCSQSLF